jgi:hypothetical protein
VQKVEARSKTEKELLAWAESLICGKAALEQEVKPVHIRAIDGDGAGVDIGRARERISEDKAAEDCDLTGAEFDMKDGDGLGEEVELVREEWSLSEDTVNPAATEDVSGYEREEGDLETPTPRSRPLDSIAPYGSPFRQFSSTAEPPNSDFNDNCEGEPATETSEIVHSRVVEEGGGNTPETLCRRSQTTARDAPLATVRQSAQKLAEIMSFLDEIEQNEEAEKYGRNSRHVGLDVIEEYEAGVVVTGESGASQGRESAKEGGDESAALATSVFDGIKKKMAGLQGQMAEAAARSEQLERQMEETQAQAQLWVEQAEARAAAQLERQQVESKRTISRHLEFIDR